MVVIGKIVKSNSHVEYVCQVYNPGERAEVPTPADYAFGRFVRVLSVQAGQPDLIGVIYNTILMNPEFGTLGPRLSSAPELEIFSPDYLSEKATLVGILVVGSMPPAEGPAFQGIPPFSAPVDALVMPLTREELRRFHEGEAGPRLAYIPHLRSQAHPLIPHLLLNILDQVIELFPEHKEQITVLREGLAWQTYVQPMS